MNFRRFEYQDAAFCFKVRANSFIQKFYGKLTPAKVAAGVNSYLPDDYIRLSEQWPFFIVEAGNWASFQMDRFSVNYPEEK